MAKIIWQARVFEGGPLFAASTATQVTVIDKSDDTLADLWSDRDGLSVKGNPFFITVAGKIEMYLDPGRYRVTATKAGQTDTWEDVLIIDPDAGGGGSAAWGGITGTLSNQTDLQSALNAKANIVVPGRTTSSTAFTLAATDSGQLIELTGASPVITIPTESTLDLGSGFTAMFAHIGTGSLTFSVSGITLKIPAELSNSAPANSVCAVTKLRSAADTWALYGFLDLS